MAANPHNPTGSSAKQNKTEHRRTHSGGGISNAISNLCKNFGFNNSESETAATTTIRKSKSNSTLDNDFETNGKKSNCDCTNISIMHLFHEMKQEFPTIPDEIVNKHVNEHCHQKNICLKLLQEEFALHPSPVQTYPSKVLQQLQHAFPKKPLKPVRKAPLPQTPIPTMPTNDSICYSALKKQQEDAEQTEKARTRPTTLDLFSAPQQQQQQQYQMVQVQLKQHMQQQQQQNHNPQDKPLILNKPVRRAPLPPVPPKPTHLRSTTTTPTTSIESDMSVNVSLISPTTLAKSLPHNKSYTSLPASCMISSNGSKSADQSPTIHRSVLNMQPQVPTVRAMQHVGNSPTSPANANGAKSFTSVNLTLRQPGSTDATSSGTIDILAGPGVGAGPGGNGFTYSSTTYNAQQGLQKTFNITVSDEGNEISASRIRSPYTPHVCLQEEQPQSPNSPNTGQRQMPAYNYNFEEEDKGKETKKIDLMLKKSEP